MKIFLLGLVLCTVLMLNAGTVQAGEPSLSSVEVDAIVSKFQTAYADTFNRRDAKGMTALFTEDATFQTDGGIVTQGRDKIEANLVKLMAQLPPETTLDDNAVSSREIAANVIVCHGVSHRLTPNAPPVTMVFTRVFVQQKGQWLLAATLIARPPTPSAAHK